MEHLGQLGEEEKNKEFAFARKYTQIDIEKQKEKLKLYVKEMQAIRKHEEILAEQKQVKQVAAKSKIVLDITHYGGEWVTQEQIDAQLVKLRETEKHKALEIKIKCHKQILQTPVPNDKKKILQPTRKVNGKPVSLEELTNNLK